MAETRQETALTTLKMLTAGLLLVGPALLACAPAVPADPLTPPTPAEMQFLDQARRLLPITPDSMVAFNSDGELLDQGRQACFMRDQGRVGYEASMLPPIVTQLALVYLCPK
ncbi:hypothetical protein PFJ02_11510 [Mycobacterium xenopi]|uniref:DUF732 domain-containing protein n=1 Tax=Mycobacterium xenopi TaxID=1789 RepID=A0AAD1GYW9_MYCXE|nr:hypothetical protein [Mycobacterium xenopi]MDA3640492.1 hypothetical protein [Mycobacterium xenopi]MDA3662678.1 hypothetical protein [Mycobacterium xenopi]BBU21255.1 hypothetical protein MYXE_10440 [Mycobacterium xenopi]SPX78853.1 Uncharacterised protein [Mycobacterium xenopi]